MGKKDRQAATQGGCVNSGDRVKMKSLGQSSIALDPFLDHTLTGQWATTVFSVYIFDLMYLIGSQA